MLEVLAIIGPIFIIIAVGFTAVRLELFSKPDIRVLDLFVINFLSILAGSVFAIFEIPLPEPVTGPSICSPWPPHRQRFSSVEYGNDPREKRP